VIRAASATLLLAALAGMSLAPGCGAPKVADSAGPQVAPLAVGGVVFTAEEREIIATLTPLAPVPPDPSNRYSDDDGAARLGQFLFFDTRLSKNGDVSCASCHVPSRGFGDGRSLPAPRFGPGLRHVPTLWNVAYNRWQFWDGRADSLWAQALDPLEHPNEHAGDRRQFAKLVRDDAALRRAYERVFGPLPEIKDDAPPRDAAATAVFVNIGKAIAAYERKLVSRRSPFDVFGEGLASGDEAKLGAIGEDAQRGLKLFIGRANCRSCHHGSNLTDGEFHDTGINAASPQAALPDAGRFDGIARLLASDFSLLGQHSDDASGKTESPTAFLVNSAERRGEFKTPTLRNIATTAPYMHRGQIGTLEDVVLFYSTLTIPDRRRAPGSPARSVPASVPGRGHMHGAAGGREHILVPLNLSKSEADDLVAFLKTLTDTGIDPSLLAQPSSPD
jgi:cytochrome c peroxidase